MQLVRLGKLKDPVTRDHNVSVLMRNPSSTMRSGVILQQIGVDFLAHGRVEVNSGVRAEGMAPLGFERFFPCGDWRIPSDPEWKMLSGTGVAPLQDSVSILRSSPALREDFWNLVAPVVLKRNSHEPEEGRRQRLWDFTRKVTDFLSITGCLQMLHLRSCDIQVTPSGKNSTAYDYQNACYIGLHLDNHDKLKLSERRDAFQLLCLNLGMADRHLHFINLTVPQICSLLESCGLLRDAHGISSQQLTAAFFHAFPEYPVTRVTLPPDYGYLATTQYIIHDGATSETESVPDVALLIAGHFERAGASQQFQA